MMQVEKNARSRQLTGARLFYGICPSFAPDAFPRMPRRTKSCAA